MPHLNHISLSYDRVMSLSSCIASPLTNTAPHLAGLVLVISLVPAKLLLVWVGEWDGYGMASWVRASVWLFMLASCVLPVSEERFLDGPACSALGSNSQPHCGVQDSSSKQQWTVPALLSLKSTL